MVNILFLGPPDRAAIEVLSAGGDTVTTTQEPITADDLIAEKAAFIVSFGYRHILGEEVLQAVPERAINLHISYLPWNRGAHPAVWSVIEGTPCGVTIHEIDRGVDTGPILAQRRVDPEDDDTFRTLHSRLQREIVHLLSESWSEIRSGSLQAQPQQGAGTTHRAAQLSDVEALLTDGWDTRVGDVPSDRDYHGPRASQ